MAPTFSDYVNCRMSPSHATVRNPECQVCQSLIIAKNAIARLYWVNVGEKYDDCGCRGEFPLMR
jgi:hypothetical protein